jgi:hypothetical protein
LELVCELSIVFLKGGFERYLGSIEKLPEWKEPTLRYLSGDPLSLYKSARSGILDKELGLSE